MVLIVLEFLLSFSTASSQVENQAEVEEDVVFTLI